MIFDALLRFRIRADKPIPQNDGPATVTRKSKRRDIRRFRTPRSSESAGKTVPNQHNRNHKSLLTIADLPPWRDPNPFILTGYRRESHSTWISLCSWGYWHNETCNIYSHLIPGVFLLSSQGVLYEYIRSKHWDLDGLDWSILTIQLLAATLCFFISALYHTLLNHSSDVAHCWLQLDYVGIIILILGNFISGLHFGFYCELGLKYFYWGLIITLGSITGLAVLSPKFRGPEYRSFRLGSFISTGLSAFAPIGHAWFLWGPLYIAKIGVPHYALEGVLLFIGCYFWERRMPERLAPGKFDYCGHSHTIWHVFVALSVGAHIWGLTSALDYVYDYEWCRVGG